MGKVCYSCGQDRMVKNGVSANGYQKYRCSNCGHSFTSKTEYVGISGAPQPQRASAPRKSGIQYRPTTSASASLADLIITVLFGWCGYWRFKNKQTALGLFWLFTLGIGGIGWIIDVVIVLISFLKQRQPQK